MLIRRYKRFLADVEVPGRGVVTMHCANTGAMLGCDTPGSPVWFSTSSRAQRKYPHTLEIVETGEGNRIGVNTARANAIVAEALSEGRIPELRTRHFRREVRVPARRRREHEGVPREKAHEGVPREKAHEGVPREKAHEAGASRKRRIRERFDFGLCQTAADEQPSTFVEVKSVTLARGCLGAFPDAVSERARRHVEALARCVTLGYRSVLLYCVPHTGIRRVTPADDIDPQYGAALRRAADGGVEVIAYGCTVSPTEITLDGALPVVL